MKGDNLKKIIILIVSFIIGIFVYNKNQNLIIPDDSIRIRIIANSNNYNDLLEKNKIKKEIESSILNLFKNVSNKEEAKNIIINNSKVIENIVSKKVDSYSINYGINYFPKKIYRGVIYNQGNYESLVITLGKGLGDNWWCVLYPPFCLINENEITDDVEYHSLVYDILKN